MVRPGCFFHPGVPAAVGASTGQALQAGFHASGALLYKARSARGQQVAAACSDRVRSVDRGAQSAAVLPSLPTESSQELDDEGRVEKCVQAAVVREGTEWEACGERGVW